VAVACCGRLTSGTVAVLRRAPFAGRASVVLVASEITEADLLIAPVAGAAAERRELL
jgi:hypothetical protein